MTALVPSAWLGSGLRDEVAAAADLIRRALTTAAATTLLTVDAGFILVHLLEWHGALQPSERLRIDKDRSASEFYEYAKLALAFLLLLILVARDRSFYLAPILALMLYLVFDNSFQLHEHVGAWATPNLRGAGEGVYLVLLGAAVFALAALSARRVDRHARVVMISLLMILSVLGFFGVLVDALHSLIDNDFPATERILGFVEDAGELISITALLLICLLHLRRPRRGAADRSL